MRISLASRVVEVFSWLLEVANDTKEHWDGGRIVWSVSYVNDGPKLAMKDAPSDLRNTNAPEEIMRRKLIAKLDIQKDDIQAVLPISKVIIRSMTGHVIGHELNPLTLSLSLSVRLFSHVHRTGR